MGLVGGSRPVLFFRFARCFEAGGGPALGAGAELWLVGERGLGAAFDALGIARKIGAVPAVLTRTGQNHDALCRQNPCIRRRDPLAWTVRVYAGTSQISKSTLNQPEFYHGS